MNVASHFGADEPGIAVSGIDIGIGTSTSTLEHVYFFDNSRKSHSAFLTAVSVDNETSGTKKVDTSVEDGDGLVERNSNHPPADRKDIQQTVPLQLCRDQKAEVAEANHENKQPFSNSPVVAGDQNLPVLHRVYASYRDQLTHHFSADLLPLPGTPLSSASSSTTPASGIPLDQTNTPDALLDNGQETRHHGAFRAEPAPHHTNSNSSGSDSSDMSLLLEEPIASAKDIGIPTVVEIPADAKSVAILKTIKADKIKRAGSTTTPISQGAAKIAKAENTTRSAVPAISIPQGTSRDFLTHCLEWGIKTVAPFTFQNAIDGLFGTALTSALTAGSSILGQISHLCVLPEKSSLVMFRNAPFHWISSTLLEFKIPEGTSVQYGGETIIIISASIKIDYTEDGTFSVSLSASRLGDDDRTWTWTEPNVGLVARFQYEDELLPVTLSPTGKNVSAEMNQLDNITVLDFIQALRLPLGALINLPLVGRMLKSIVTCASFEYSRLSDRSSSPLIVKGRVVFRRERLKLGPFNLSDPEFSIVYSSSRSLVSVDEGQWTFQISALQAALQMKTEVDYAAVDYLARLHVQPKATLGLVDFLKLLAPDQLKAASQKALKDFTVDKADVVLDTSDWSAISCSGDMRFPGGLPSLFEYDAYSSDEIALTSTIEVPIHGYDVDIMAFQSFFDARPEVLAKQKDTTFAIEDDEIMVAAPLNNDELWRTLALAVKEHAQTDGTIIGSASDEVPEVVWSIPSHPAFDTEAKDERATFLKVHRTSVLQMATAVVPGSSLPSPTMVTIASGTDGSAAGSARRASRLIPSMSTPPPAVVPISEEECEITGEQERGIDGIETIKDFPADDQVASSSEDFASTWLGLPTHNEKQASRLSMATDSINGDNLDRPPSVIPEKSVTSSTFPSPSPSVASSTPKFEQRELDQKSSTSSLGSEFQTSNKDSPLKPTLYTTPEERTMEIGPKIGVQEPHKVEIAESGASIMKIEGLTDDFQLSELKQEVSRTEATSTMTSPVADKVPIMEAIHGFDFSDAFSSSIDFTLIEEPFFADEQSLVHENEAVREPLAPDLVHAVSSDVASKENVSSTMETDFVENVSPTTEEDGVEEAVTPTTQKSLDATNHTILDTRTEKSTEECVQNETPIEEETRAQRARRDWSERRPARRVRGPSSLEEISEASPPSTATPSEQVEQKPVQIFTEHTRTMETKPTITSLQSSQPKPEESSKASTTIAATDDIRPVQSATSDLATNKRSRRKSLLPSKSMRNLLKRVSSFGNMKEQPLPPSRNIPTSHSDTAVPLPPLVLNGSFASGTTEGWQVDAGRNTVKVLKEDSKGYKHKIVVTVRRSSLSGACLRQRLATEAGSKLQFSMKLKYDLVGDGVLSVLVDGKIVARHQASSGQGEVFDVQGAFVTERRGTLLELEMKSPFGKMMVFEISGVVIERVGGESFV